MLKYARQGLKSMNQVVHFAEDLGGGMTLQRLCHCLPIKHLQITNNTSLCAVRTVTNGGAGCCAPPRVMCSLTEFRHVHNSRSQPGQGRGRALEISS